MNKDFWLNKQIWLDQLRYLFVSTNYSKSHNKINVVNLFKSFFPMNQNICLIQTNRNQSLVDRTKFYLYQPKIFKILQAFAIENNLTFVASNLQNLVTCFIPYTTANSPTWSKCTSSLTTGGFSCSNF